MNPHESRARAAIELKRWDLAREELVQALAEEPNDPYLHGMLAQSHFCLKDFPATREVAEEVIRLAPDLGLGYYWLAWGLLVDPQGVLDRQVRVRETVDTLLACDPDNADALYVAAASLLDDDPLRAIERSQAGLAIDPEHDGCLQTLAIAQVELDRCAEAETTLRRILARDPESEVAHKKLATIYLRKERFAQAYEHSKSALAADPNDPEILNLHTEVVRHQVPLARFLLRSARMMRKLPYLLPTLGFASFVWAILANDYFRHSEEEVRTLGVLAAFIPFLIVMFYQIFAALAAETAIAFSARHSRQVPERRRYRAAYALAWIGPFVALGGIALSAAIRSPYPFLLAGSGIVLALVLVWTQGVEVRWLRRCMQFISLLPLSFVLVFALLAQTPEGVDNVVGLTFGAWAMAIVAALGLRGVR